MNEIAVDRIDRAIKQWARRKRALISLSCYAREIEMWGRTAGVRKVRRLLEIGSGSGWFLVAAVVFGFAGEATGIDPAIPEAGTQAEDIANTESVIQEVGLSDRVHLRSGTFQNILRGSQEPYDLLVFRNVLHHIYPKSGGGTEDKYASRCVDDLSSARGLFTTAGYVYVVEVDPGSWLWRATYNLLRTLRGAPTIDWKTKRTAQEWKRIFEKAGFQSLGLARLPLHHPLLAAPGVEGLARVLSQSFLLAGRAR
ncbi:MAG TPA: methyltransferase domain-containing protein [Anaerolineae bacterium]|nr:methyltransferase domain-containing protein [Anaerolineae bacterium]